MTADYAELGYAELKQAIDDRNGDRADDAKISKGGGADDLRKRLVADDAAQPAEPEPTDEPTDEPLGEDEVVEPDEQAGESEPDDTDESGDEPEDDDGIAEAEAEALLGRGGMNSILAGPSTYDVNPLLARGLEL